MTRQTPPLRKHQVAALERFTPFKSWALWWDPGVGKSAPTAHVAAHHFREGAIDRVLIVAPKGVHTNWATDELPKHCPVDYLAEAWDSKRAKTKDQQGRIVRLLKYVDGLKVLCIAFDGLRTEAGRDDVRRFLKGGPTMMVVDEIHRIKNPKAKCSKLCHAAGQLAKIRVGLTGTSITNSPFDAYSQVKFLDPGFWKQRQIGGFVAFKHAFGVFEQAYYGGRKVEELKEYRNLDKLKGWLAEVGHRLAREDAVDLPPQTFVKRKFQLSTDQRHTYDELVAQYRAELADGTVIDAPLALQRIMKLHQVACGFVRDAEGNDLRIGDEMPRLDVLEELLADIDEQVIVWTRFRADARAIMKRLNNATPVDDAREDFEAGSNPSFDIRPDWDPKPLGPVAGRYDGTVGDGDRLAVIEAFRAGRIKVLVANPQSIGIGVTLNEAKVAVYYSHDYRLETRIQSEARNYRIGQDRGVLVVDIVAEKTVDEHVIEALVGKMDVARLVQGDKWKEWIR